MPLLIQWPDKWPKQTIYEHAVSTIDIVPTTMKAMGAKSNVWDGKDLTPMVLSPQKNPNRELHFRYMGQLASVVGKYKIIHSVINTRVEVYDLKNDPYEKQNVASRTSGIISRAMEECRKWNLDNREVEMFKEGEKFAIDQKYKDFDSRR